MKKSVAIIGGGPSAMMLAAHLDEKKFDCTIYEKNTALGRKFLVAGDGGLNLSHSENTADFISRYTPSSFIQKSITTFNADDLRKWFHSIGIETFIGSSKRIFPLKGIKPIEVLNSILKVLEKKGVHISTQHTLSGWENNELFFDIISSDKKNKKHNFSIQPDIVVFALGGASWRVTGSNGDWLNLFEKQNIKTIPFQASNCAFAIKWEKDFISKHEGKSLKNISVKCEEHDKKGELTITKSGLEGGAIYALSPFIRKKLKETQKAEITINLKPAFTSEEINAKLINRGNKSVKQQLANSLKFDSTQIDLLKQVTSKDVFMNPNTLALAINNIPLTIIRAAPIDEAISTVGGIPLSEIDANFQLKKIDNNYVIGEMLDWDAPTGGFLLQGCFSMGVFLANHLNDSF